MNGSGESIGDCKIEVLEMDSSASTHYISIKFSETFFKKKMELTVRNHPLTPHYQLTEYRNYWDRDKDDEEFVAMEVNVGSNAPFIDNVIIAPIQYRNIQLICSIKKEV